MISTFEIPRCLPEIKKPLIKDAVEFILKNRKDSNAFKGMNGPAIVKDILECAEDNGVAYCIEDEAGMTGIITCEVNREYQILFVHHMLSITPVATLTLCIIFSKYYRNYDIQAVRDGSNDFDNSIRYKNTKRLVRLLAHISNKHLTKKD